MKILLLGKDGQVGWELQRSLAPLGHVVAPARSDRLLCGDLSRIDDLADTVRRVRPDVIVNAAAYTEVDRAEAEPELTRLVNATAVGVLAREAESLDAWLVHYSTDYVFDGLGNVPWTEDDEPAPISVYGRSKLEGEIFACREATRHLVFRTSWIYAARGRNFVKSILRLAQDRDSLKVVADQFGAPTGADLVADITALSIRQALSRQDGLEPGIYHLAGAGETSWWEYARFIATLASELGYGSTLSADRIEAIPTDAYVTAAPRPKNCRLNTEKLRRRLGICFPHWKSGVSRMITELLETSSP